MNKYAVLGELLYLISNKEKALSSPNKIWTKKDIKRLLHSLDILDRLISFMNKDTLVFFQDIQFSVDYLEREFSVAVITPNDRMPLLDNPVIAPQDSDRVISLMHEIINNIRQSLHCKEKSYKREIWKMLHALHNLPLVYVAEKGILLNTTYCPIKVDEALQFANWWYPNIKPIQ